MGVNTVMGWPEFGIFITQGRAASPEIEAGYTSSEECHLW